MTDNEFVGTLQSRGKDENNSSYCVIDNVKYNIPEYVRDWLAKVPNGALVLYKCRDRGNGQRDLTKIKVAPVGQKNPPTQNVQQNISQSSPQSPSQQPPSPPTSSTQPPSSPPTSSAPSVSPQKGSEKKPELTEVGMCTLTIGGTINLQNYENLRVEISGPAAYRWEMVEYLKDTLDLFGEKDPVTREMIESWKRRVLLREGEE